MKKYWIIIIFSLFLIIGLCFFPIVPALTITHGKSQQLVFASRVSPGDHFVIRYIHSIHRTPIQEEYEIDPYLNIVLNKVTYESYGVGNPSNIEPGETFEMKDGKFIIGNMRRVLPFFDQAIGQVIANHQLQIRGQWIPLSQVSLPGSWVRIQAKKISLWQMWTAHPYTKP